MTPAAPVTRHFRGYGSDRGRLSRKQSTNAIASRARVVADLEQPSDDCQEAVHEVRHHGIANATATSPASDVHEPLNIGSDELVTIDQLIDIVEEIAGVTLKRRYNLNAPLGVRGRSSDNTLIRQKLGWAPSIRLRDGMEKTYGWIHEQMMLQADTRRVYS